METFLFRRELFGSKSNRNSLSHTRDYENLWLNRLGVTNTLEGHGGCVNTLRWNNNGTLLASGSDDRHVIIWDISGEKKTKQGTNHDGNIFGVEFLPYGDDKIVATCAGDHMVKLHDLEKKEELHSYSADGRVKRLATAQDDPYLYFSAGEDGIVRQHDARTNDVFGIVDDAITKSVKTIAICQGRTEMLAVGTQNFFVPIYDRRMLDGNGKAKIMVQCAPADNTLKNPRIPPLYSTHVAFDYLGKELIINQNGGMSGGVVFSFNLNESEKPTPTCQKLQSILDGCLEYHEEEENPLEPRLAELKNKAKGFMENPETRNFSKAIRLYTECLFGGFKLSRQQKSILYANRSVAQVASQKTGEFYSALRDAIESILLNPNYAKGYWRLMKSLLLMKQYQLAEEVLAVFKKRFPEATELNELEKQLLKVNREEKTKPRDLRDPSVPMIDYEGRFVGHRNMHTDIKEANFFGSENQYIVSGSDCGSLIIWDRVSGLVKKAFNADEDILNICCIHPDKFLIATSGIEHVIRFWEPLPEGEKEPREKDIEEMLSVPIAHIDHLYYLQALIHLNRAVNT